MFPSKYAEMIGIQYASALAVFFFQGTLCSWKLSLATTNCTDISGGGGGCKRKIGGDGWRWRCGGWKTIKRLVIIKR